MSLKTYNFDLQGHRGARGVLPENSLEAFQKAIEIGVNTLELDVIISKDSYVVVSHEAYMNPDICLTPSQERIKDKTAYNLYKMTYKDIKAFDCGSLKHPDFPDQKPQKTYKPLLSQVLELAVKNPKDSGQLLDFNIEIKSLPETDNVYHPEPEIFTDLVVKVIKQYSIPSNQITLQSFDSRVIDYISLHYPEYKTAYLVEASHIEENLKHLKKIPHIYSPLYTLLDTIQIKQAHKKGIKVIPWTVNDVSDMQELLEMGVDGIITDYPNLAKPFHSDR